MIVFKCCVYRLLDYEVFRGVLFFFQFVAISTSATFRTRLSQISFRLLRLKCATSVSGASFSTGLTVHHHYTSAHATASFFHRFLLLARSADVMPVFVP